jgi:uncharacterized membrane-anchored protein YjiN (DUF445 family)
VLSLALYLASWPLGLANRTVADIVRAAGEASLIGGLCDFIALNMIFEQHWYIPNSGVLPRNRVKLIEGIANTIETQWLTPAMIGRKIHELRPLDRLGEYLRGASLKTVLTPSQLERLCEEAARHLEPDAIIAFIQRIRSQIRPVGPIGRVRAAIVKAFVRKECERVREIVRALPHNDESLAAIDAMIHDMGASLSDSASALRVTADHWMEALVREVVVASRGEIAMMVKANLAELSNDTIRAQIEARTRTHLDWIRVNGSVFGAILGCIFALIQRFDRDFHLLAQIVRF